MKGKACVQIKKPQACSIRGQVLNKRGTCVCPRGTEVIDGACRRVDTECAPGSRMIDGICQPIIRRRCPVGTTGRYPDCFPIRRRPGVEIEPDLLLNPNILQQVLPRSQPRLQRNPATNNLQ